MEIAVCVSFGPYTDCSEPPLHDLRRTNQNYHLLHVNPHDCTRWEFHADDEIVMVAIQPKDQSEFIVQPDQDNNSRYPYCRKMILGKLE